MRNEYDSDITIWSPEGRLIQVEYAMKAVEQGSACVGLKSKTHVVLLGLQRRSSDLSSYLNKIVDVDDHMGLALSGLTADGRVLSKWLRTECLEHKYVYDTPIQTNRIVRKLADKSQVSTQRYGGRPYGVGLLIAGFDRTGTHLFETDPAGNFYEYKAQAIGAKSQSARTYLESNYEDFADCTLDKLIKHGLLALRETLPRRKSKNDKEPDNLDSENCAVAIVGENLPFTRLSPEQIETYLEQIETENPRAVLRFDIDDPMDQDQ